MPGSAEASAGRGGVVSGSTGHSGYAMNIGCCDWRHQRKHFQAEGSRIIGTRSKQESPVREIRTLGLMRRGLETDLRWRYWGTPIRKRGATDRRNLKAPRQSSTLLGDERALQERRKRLHLGPESCGRCREVSLEA